MRKPWPMAAQAWRCRRSVGRLPRPSRPMPAPMAPELTRATLRPVRRIRCTWSASDCSRSGSRVPSGPVRTLVPTFTALVWSGLVLPPAFGAGAFLPPSRVERLLAEAREVEKEGQWLGACVLYEKLLKEEHGSAEARAGYHRCLRHLHLARRHRDA